MFTAVLCSVGLAAAARADVTGSYDGRMTGKKIATPLEAAAALAQTGKLLSGTLVVGGSGPLGGVYLVNGKATPKKVKLSGANPGGARVKWTGKIAGDTVQGKGMLKAGKTKVAGTLALMRNVSADDGSACDAVYQQNATTFDDDVLGDALTPCTTCHIAGGQAAATRFRITAADPLATARTVALLVDPTSPAASRIVAKPTGVLPHGGLQQILPGSAQADILIDWATLVAQSGCR
jgi:hypothetical protein